MTRPFISTQIIWRGITIAVRYCPDWMPSYSKFYGYPLAHLEIEALDPPGSALPVTETGYRSALYSTGAY